MHREPRSQGGERYHNLSSQKPSDRATASDRLLSSRVQKRPKRVSQKPVPGRPAAAQKSQDRKQPQSLIGGLSGTPAVFDRAETFPWGSIKFTYPDGSVVDTSPSKEKIDISSVANMPLEVITMEEFRVVAMLASNIKKLFPHENDGYWSTIVTGFQLLEQKVDRATKKTQGNIEYYDLQLNLVLGIYPTLIKSISGRIRCASDEDLVPDLPHQKPIGSSMPISREVRLLQKIEFSCDKTPPFLGSTLNSKSYKDI
ncbi:hypothetical protein TWF594_007711 [Orbilia oligospora]|nr:hypothetical protein TWF594_007711 [Orbilia oligospora]